MKDLHVRLLVLVLTVSALLLVAWKVSVLNLPLLPSDGAVAWNVEARIDFEARGVPATIEFHVPSMTPNFTVIDEDFVAGDYGLSVDRGKENRLAVWSGRRPRGMQALYYRILLHQDGDDPILSRDGRRPLFPKTPDYPENVRIAIDALLGEVRAHSADVATFTRVLLQRLAKEGTSENVDLLRDHFELHGRQVEGLRRVLAGVRIPSRISWGLQIRDGVRSATLDPWLEVHNGDEWLIFNPFNGARGAPADTLFWYTGTDALLDTNGPGPASAQIAIRRSFLDVYTLAEKKADLRDSRVMDFSLLALPLQTQNVYRILLMVPLGALIVVLMRNVVGMNTFGTFMPVLIALAFRETHLLWGVFLFVLLISMGLSIRFYFERLKLLLVPRLASVVTVVVLLMAGISVVSANLGLQRGLSVALFPMVIMAMTIERASIIWEENGALEAFRQGLGTLVVALLGYMVMFNEILQHMVFLFPELLLVVLATTLLLGRYTGYRLTELRRFRSFVQEQKL